MVITAKKNSQIPSDVELNLSSSGLTSLFEKMDGMAIIKHLTLMTNLQVLDISRNNLTALLLPD